MHKQSSRHDRRHLSGPHFPSNLPSVQVEIRRGKAKNLVRAVGGPVYLIGTARDCDLVLGDRQFPEAFAYIFVSESEVTIRRLGVGPELTVNGQAVNTTRLEDGDRIRTGPFEFCMQITWPVRGGDSAQRRSAGRTRPRPSGRRRKMAQQRVDRLLSDIRQAMFPPAVGLRIYVGPDEPPLEPHVVPVQDLKRASA